MSRKPKAPLRVVANPFVALDHEGRPAAAVAFDTGDRHTGNARRLIAASFASELIEARDPVTVGSDASGNKVVSGDGRKSRHDVWFSFSADAVIVPDSRHHRRALDPACGGQPALLAADEDTARRIGQKFVNPSDVIVETAKVRLAEFVKDNGELPEWAHLHAALLPSGSSVSLKKEAVHVSHQGHAEFLAAHVAKVTTKAVAASKGDSK